MPKGNERILIVDDEENLARSLALILQRAGYRVETAPNAATGMQLLEAQGFDLLFLDIRLPDQSGTSLLPRIRELYPDMPVVMLTAFDRRAIALGAIRSGARDFMLKPIEPEEILERTNKILSSN